MKKGRLRIGLILDYIVSEYSELIVSGIRNACQNKNIEFLLFPIGELHDIRAFFDYQNVAVTAFISKSNLDGVIFVSGTQMHYMTKAEVTSYIKSFLPLPIVNISAVIPGIPSINVDSYNAYKAIIDNLIDEQGCKKFGVLGVRSNSNEAKYRRNSIKSILEEREVPSKNVTFWKADFEYKLAFSELEYYFTENGKFDFDAVLCLNDEMAYAALDFCHNHGLKVPEDVCIVGFDDLERSSFCTPALSSINQEILEQGYKAVELLEKIINGEKVSPITTVEATAVMRESTCRHKYSKEFGQNQFVRIDTENKMISKLNFSGTEWYLKKGQFSQIARYYTEIQYNMTSEQLMHRINGDVRAFGVKACAVVLYENPIEMPTPFDYFNLPHKARVYAAFDDATGYDSNKNPKRLMFNPKTQLLPDDIYQYEPEGDVVLALFHNTLQYGYIVLRRGDYDSLVYDLLVKMLSSIVSSVYSFALVNSETTKYRAKYDKMDVIASTDELTGLNNRRGLYEVGQATLKLAEKMGQHGMVIYSDMDGLKKINDTYGHEAGDRAILAESIILKGNFRSNDIISRIGGDEFAIICPGLTLEAFERIKEQIDKDCALWTEGNKAGFTLSISMGCMEYPSDKVGYQITPLLSEADSLMYIEKRNKKKLQKDKS